MPHHDNIILVGFMASGKSHVGRILSERTDMPLVDADTVIVERAGKSIEQIFADEGEGTFRALEREVMAKLCGQPGQIISAGGGAFVDPENRRAMLEGGTVFCLQARPETIYQRLRADNESGQAVRPLLAGPDPLGRIRELLAQRAEAYGQAHHCIDTDGLTPEEVAERVMAAWTGEERVVHSEFVGVDGCSAGWFSVGLCTTGVYELMGFFAFEDLLNYYKKAKLILVDIPIGLPKGEKDAGGGRDFERKAKEKLRPYGPRVFFTPTRYSVDKAKQSSGSYNEVYNIANKAEREATGSGLSPLSFSLVDKIHEVDTLLPRQTPRVREVHPEICFWALNGKRALVSKHTPAGVKDRIAVLDNVLNDVEWNTDDILKKARRKYQDKYVADHDILDALAAAVTAYRGHLDQFQTLPATPTQDERGLTMEMVYWTPPKD